jgi:hypothetical protein
MLSGFQPRSAQADGGDDNGRHQKKVDRNQSQKPSRASLSLALGNATENGRSSRYPKGARVRRVQGSQATGAPLDRLPGNAKAWSSIEALGQARYLNHHIHLPGQNVL